MCGIAGLLELSGQNLSDPTVARLMADQLQHRGPDDEGFYADGPMAFGFRRLSVIDVSGGHQPISNEDGSVWAMLNGEIYNYVELRDTLKPKHAFRTASDTEVVVHAYEEFGLDFVDHLRGMFALAVWDGRRRRLVLARDRIGKKPLFYSVANNQLAFASELKGLLPWRGLDRTLDLTSIHDYLSFLYVPAPRSIFKSVKKLQPAHILIADIDSGRTDIRRYWQLNPEPNHGLSHAALRSTLRELLEESIRLRLRSDVPLGVFLSGGIDSSAVAGLASQFQGADSLRTVTMAFEEPRFDERGYARLLADKWGTDHVEQVFSPISAQEWQRLVWYLDEPFADSSAIPTYALSKLARQQVKVVLSGDGGDELFAGYPRYRYARLIERVAAVPRPLLRSGIVISGLLEQLLSSGSAAGSDRLRRVRKALEISAASPSQRMFMLLAYFEEETKRSLYSDALADQMTEYSSAELVSDRISEFPPHEDPIVNLMARDLQTNLVDDTLVKVDRMSMACSLEVRSPFLDHRLVEFAATIPPDLKLRQSETKAILKEAVSDILPQEIQHRDKSGFEVPFSYWFSLPDWREMILDCLGEDAVKKRGLFQPASVVALRDAALREDGHRDLGISQHQLWHRFWMLLSLELWCRQYLTPPSQS